MKTPELFIEYLIVGSFSVIWILPILNLFDLKPTEISVSNLIIILPGVYVIGLILDSIGSTLVKGARKRVEKTLIAKHKLTEEETEFCFTHARIAKFLVTEPEFVKADQMRSSRYKIARSTMVSFIFFTLTITIINILKKSAISITITSFVIGLLLVWFSWNMWKRYLIRHSEFIIFSLRVISQEENNSNRLKS